MLQTGTPLQIAGATGSALLKHLPILGHIATGAYEVKGEIERGETPLTSVVSEIGEQLIEMGGVAAGGTMGARFVEPLMKLIADSSPTTGGGRAGNLVRILGTIAGSIGGGIVGSHVGEKFERGVFGIGAGRLGPRAADVESWKQRKEQARLDEDNLEKILPDYMSPERKARLEKVREYSPYAGTVLGGLAGAAIGMPGGGGVVSTALGIGAGAALGGLGGEKFGDWYFRRGRRKARQEYYDYEPEQRAYTPADDAMSRTAKGAIIGGALGLASTIPYHGAVSPLGYLGRVGIGAGLGAVVGRTSDNYQKTYGEEQRAYAPAEYDRPLSEGMKWKIPSEIEMVASEGLKGKSLDQILNSFRTLQAEVESQLPQGGKDLSSRKAVIAKVSGGYLEHLEELRNELNQAAKSQNKHAVANLSKEIDEYLIRYVVNVLRSSTGMGGIHTLSDPYKVKRPGGYVGSDDSKSVTLGRPQAFSDVVSLDAFYTRGLDGIAKKNSDGVTELCWSGIQSSHTLPRINECYTANFHKYT